MKQPAFLAAMLLAIGVSTAPAAGLNLHWDNCVAGGGVQNKSFPCDDDFQTFELVAQFRLPSALNGVTGVEYVLDLAAAGPTLPQWWHFRFDECRPNQLLVNTVVPIGVGCPDWAGGLASGGVNPIYVTGLLGPNTARIEGGSFVSSANARNLTNLTADYFLVNLLIQTDNTTTSGSSGVACPGCDVPVCIVFNRCLVATPNTLGLVINTAQTQGSNFVTWQGGQGVTTFLGSGCPAATPTRASTWGAVKSLYR
ncbi:MAG TPA: hypothetical protein VI504_00975 [Candidatus Eisenbacteria bacterium]|jgi:hypothetical protein